MPSVRTDRRQDEADELRAEGRQPGAWCAARRSWTCPACGPTCGPRWRTAPGASPGGRPRRHALYAPGGPAMAAARAQPAQDSVRGPELWPPRAGGRPRLPAHPRCSSATPTASSATARTWKPRASDRYDYEGELAVVIGRAGRHIAARDALSHVAGYTCMAENSVRDFQKHNAQVTPGKNFERSGALEPLAGHRRRDRRPGAVAGDDAAERRDPATGRGLGPDFSHRRADRLHQRLHPLSPGDVIATGTPEAWAPAASRRASWRQATRWKWTFPAWARWSTGWRTEPAPAHQEQGDAHG